METGPEHLDVKEPLWFLQRLHGSKQLVCHVPHLRNTPLHLEHVQPIAKFGRLQLLEDLSGASYPRQDLLQLSG